MTLFNGSGLMVIAEKEDDFNAWKNKDTENFPVGSFLISAHLRPHIHAYYSFARAADNVSDDPLIGDAEKLCRLSRFEDVLNGAQENDVPSAAAMRESLVQTNISKQHCLDLIRAFKQDSTKRRYQNWQELLDYCRYSASPVGRYVLALHGVGEAAWPYNDALCSALQVINHLQDCADDYRELDRVYLPLDDMEAAGATTGHLAGDEASPALRRVLDKQLERLAPMLLEARKLPKNVPDIRLKLEISIIVALAESLVKLLKTRDPLRDDVKLSKPGIAMAALAGILRAFT